MCHNYTYAAFGELEGRSGQTKNSYQFTGEQFDEDLGEYYLRQRYYDSEIGRFTRRDNYEGSLEDPISLHKYLYANANPIYYTDPSGNSSIGQAVAISVLTGILAELLSPDPLQNPTWEGDYTRPNPYRGPFEIIAGVLTGAALTKLTSTVTNGLSTSTIGCIYWLGEGI